MKLTWSSLAYRSLWELDRRSGFKALRTPRGSVPIPNAVPSFDAWYAALGEGHRLRRLRDEPPQLLWRRGGVPQPLDWHLEPNSGLRWPAREHWTRAIDAPVGDLRLTWERNRFAHVWEWIADQDQRAGDFATQLTDWRRLNPYRSGVNWASGQELAVRSLAWLAGAAVYAGEFPEDAWRDLVELLYWHGVQIESEFGLARYAVRNNHLIAEGLALAALGDAFGCLEDANRWKWRGLEAIEEAVGEQFFADGGYCQCSHAYHHFALQLLLEAWAWFDELHGVLRPVFERSLRYFEAIVQNGRVPNFGPNDRVLEPDFDALLTALCSATGLQPGSTPDLASFPDTGLHVLRSDAVTATLRCGELPDRAGHDDGLHVEVWCNDVPVAIDAGSYIYSDPNHWYANARSHNVCLVGSSEPRARLARFTWDRVAQPWLVEFDPRRRRALARYDTAFADVTWEREVSLRGATAVVTDVLNGLSDGPEVFHIHWLLDAPPDVIDWSEGPRGFTWNISMPTATVRIDAEALNGGLDAPHLNISAAYASPRYGERSVVTSVMLTVVAPAVRFRTSFEPR